MYDISTMPGYIPIGNQRDFGHTVQFDLSAWADLNADDWKITYTRPGESATYPVPDGDVSVADNVLTWTISEAVTAINGTGSVIIEAYRGDEMLKHSARIMTIIGDGHEPAGEAPDPVADWIADATSKLAEVDHFVDETIDATEAANAAAGLTNDAIGRANAISETMEGIAPLWSGVDISVSALGEGADPTASITQGETGTSISLGIPKGDTGAQGPAGPQGIQGEKGDTGAKIVTAEWSGDDMLLTMDDESEVTIEDAKTTLKGDPGDISNIKVDGQTKTKSAGAVDLTSDFSRYALWRKTTTNPTTVYPVPESPLYARVSGTPVQSGTGDPSPDNVRPISPWVAQGAAVGLKRTGRNLLNLSTDGVYIASGYTGRSHAKPIFLANRVVWGASATGYLNKITGGTYSTNPLTGDAIVNTSNSSYGLCFRVDVLPNVAYRFNVDVRVGYYDKDFTYLSHNYAASSITTPPNAAYMLVVLTGPVGETTEFKALQMELGSTATPYEPYSGTDIALTAPQDIWGGWVDNEGTGAVTWGYIASYVDETVPGGWVSSTGQLSTGAQVAYPLATPTPLTLTPAPLTALAQVDRTTPRQNVVTASTGTLEVTYAKSPIRESDEIRAAIALAP